MFRLIGLAWTTMALLTTLVIVLFVKYLKEKRICRELKAYLNSTDMVLQEFRKIRHQYNNMFQKTVCYIENEEWGSLKEQKNEILQKTAALNRSNALQFIKIRNFNIGNLLSGLAGFCAENGINFRLSVSDELKHIEMSNTIFCNAIRTYFNSLIKAAGDNIQEITFKICPEGRGVLFVVDSFCCFEPVYPKDHPGEITDFGNYLKGQAEKLGKTLEKYRNVVFNNYTDQEHFKLEISILNKR